MRDLTVEDFLEERLREINAQPHNLEVDNLVTAMRELLEHHKQWVMLLTKEPKLEEGDFSNPLTYTIRMSQEIDFLTRDEYKRRFGSEAPTASVIREWARTYYFHPDFNREWLLG